jgi:flagellar M-ring protein FliF
VLEQILRTLREAKERSAQALSALSPEDRRLLFRALPIFVLIVALGAYLLFRARFRPLFTNLSPQDAAAVVRELEAQDIPYFLRKGGSVIEVPQEVLYRTRLQLAGKGLPMGGGVGFEIFEHSPFGVTEFTQRVNYLRALQGELARTISSLAAVQSSRVHLALPARSAFMGPQSKPSASIVVDLRAGFELAREQVRGIANLAASSVEGLAAERVTVLDSLGNLLWPDKSEAAQGETGLLYRLKARVEREMERRIETMLVPVVGAGKAVARVSADMDFRETQRTAEKFDPAAQVVRSQQEEIEEPSEAAGGVPGVQANTPGAEAQPPPAPVQTKRSRRVLNYELNRTTSQVFEPKGRIRRLSVAVLVDGNYEDDQYVARSPEEMAMLKTIVMKAVGFDAERGDEIEVANVPFKVEPPAPIEEPAGFDLRRWAASATGIAVGAGLLILLFVLVVGVRVRRGHGGGPSKQKLTMEAARQEVEQGLSGAVEKITVAEDPRREQLAQIARDYRDHTVRIVRMWLRDSEQKRRAEASS